MLAKKLSWPLIADSSSSSYLPLFHFLYLIIFLEFCELARRIFSPSHYLLLLIFK
jgi:hypothetical protein